MGKWGMNITYDLVTTTFRGGTRGARFGHSLRLEISPLQPSVKSLFATVALSIRWWYELLCPHSPHQMLTPGAALAAGDLRLRLTMTNSLWTIPQISSFVWWKL